MRGEGGGTKYGTVRVYDEARSDRAPPPHPPLRTYVYFSSSLSSLFPLFSVVEWLVVLVLVPSVRPSCAHKRMTEQIGKLTFVRSFLLLLPIPLNRRRRIFRRKAGSRDRVSTRSFSLSLFFPSLEGRMWKKEEVEEDRFLLTLPAERERRR